MAKNTWRKYLATERGENSSYAAAWDRAESRRKLSRLAGWDVTRYRNIGHALRACTATPYRRRPVFRSGMGRVTGGLCMLLGYPQTGAGNLPSAGTRQSNDIFKHWQWPQSSQQIGDSNGFRFAFKYPIAIVKVLSKWLGLSSISYTLSLICPTVHSAV